MIQPRPYLSIEQLAELTPWSVGAIDRMVRRGILLPNIHYFQSTERGKRTFKWSAIVEFIEGNPNLHVEQADEVPAPRSRRRRGPINVEQVETELRRLHDRAA